MVMQCAALVTGVGGIVLMLVIAGVKMVGMIVRDAPRFGQVRGNVLCSRQGMLEMEAAERHDTERLG
jgi:hypothetical protein